MQITGAAMKTLPCNFAAGRYVLLVTVAWGWLTACALAPADRPEGPSALTAAEAVFLEAEALFDAEDYAAAIARYNTYLLNAPQGRWAAASLMKIGTAYQQLDRPLDAMDHYQRVLSFYPDLPFAIDAYLELIELYARNHRFGQILERLPPGDPADMSPGQRLRFFTLRGDTYMAVGYPADAYVQYRAALGVNGDESALAVAPRLEESIRQLSLAENQLFIEGETDAHVNALLLYYLGLRQAEAEQFDLAVETLSIFAGLYADHPYIGSAFTLMEEFSHQQQFTPFTLGCLLPLSGPYAAYGQRALRGIELALSQWATQNWHPFRLVVRDSQGDAQAALDGLASLVEEGVGAVIGPMVTAAAVAPKAQEMGLPIIVMTQKTNITATGPYIFRNFMTPEMQMQALAAYAVDRLGLRRFAILYPEEPYGERFMQQFWRSLAARGGEVTAVEAYDPKKTDFAGPIKKLVGHHPKLPAALTKPALIQDPQRQLQAQLDGGIQSLPEQLFESPTAWIMDGYRTRADLGSAGVGKADPALPQISFEAIFLPDSPRKAGLVIPQLAYYDIRHAQLLGTNLWHSQQLIEMARKYVQGAILTDGVYLDGVQQTSEGLSTPDPVVGFATLFRAVYASEPDLIAATAFDTAEILFAILSESEIRLRRDVKNRLHQAGPFPGITGQTTFSHQGEAQKALHLLQIQGPKFVAVGRIAAGTAPLLPTDPPQEQNPLIEGGSATGVLK
jgi:ABC-type branched-subunit amino acid transport system substrate-binding protein